jgi:hypothetical protein
VQRYIQIHLSLIHLTDSSCNAQLLQQEQHQSQIFLLVFKEFMQSLLVAVVAALLIQLVAVAGAEQAVTLLVGLTFQIL